jgi:quercetin dioxygenase-like cupin family protein
MTEHEKLLSAPAGPRAARRVIVGVDRDGRSTVMRDGVTSTRSARPNGALVQEIWRQERLPARANDDGTRDGEVDGEIPAHGAVVRTYTLPPGHEVDEVHRNECLHVITIVSGAVRVLLETAEVVLFPGDSLVLPGSMHTLRNAADEPVTMVYTAFALAR